MPFRFRRPDPHARITEMRLRRMQLIAELDAAEEEAAWLTLSDELSEQLEGRQWAAQAEALRGALAELEVRILRAELDGGLFV